VDDPDGWLDTETWFTPLQACGRIWRDWEYNLSVNTVRSWARRGQIDTRWLPDVGWQVNVFDIFDRVGLDTLARCAAPWKPTDEPCPKPVPPSR
jgi:hypothetical protein